METIQLLSTLLGDHAEIPVATRGEERVLLAERYQPDVIRRDQNNLRTQPLFTKYRDGLAKWLVSSNMVEAAMKRLDFAWVEAGLLPLPAHSN